MRSPRHRVAGYREFAPAADAAFFCEATGALEIVRRTSGRVRCERIAGELGVSMRHLRRQVRDSMGVSPKCYARVLRFATAMQTADATARPAWADIAARTGYCDQSHLIRDAVAMTGFSPAALHLERRQQVVAAAAVSGMSNPR